MPADTVRALARDLAAADGAAVYGRTGSCLGRFGTLVAFLLDLLNARDRQPRPPRRRGLRAAGDRARRGRRAGRPRHLRQGALADRRLPRRARRAARVADGARDDDARRAPDPRLLHERRQPGAELPERRGARAGARDARPLRLDSTSTSTRPTATPTTSCRHDVARARRPADRLPRLLHDAVRAVRRAGRRAARRGARGVADHRRDRQARSGSRPTRIRRCACSRRLGYRITPQRLRRPAAAHRPRRRPASACARAGSASSGWRKHPHGVVTAPTIPTGVLRGARAPRRRQGAARPRRRCAASSRGWAPSTATTRTSRCG